ncbi:MAG: peptidogalycan biosysnthesis protein, partial [Cyanobacteria bacterium]|nr:peptidogalycan biosysnthesis protein [Cyanobacteriota bacterium]
MDARSEYRLEVEIHSRLDSVSPEDWNRLFVGFPDSLAMVQMVQSSGFDGMKQHSIVVKSFDKPILLLPLFDTLHKVEFLYRGWGHQWLYQIAPFLPKLFHPRILGVGFVEGEWGQVGYDPDVSLSVLEEGWKLALETLNTLAQSLKSDLISFVDFNTESGKMLPVNLLKNYTQVESYPCGVLPVTFSSVEEYISSLSKHMRKDLRRKMKSLNDIEVVRTTEIVPYLDRVFYLYQETIARSDLKFGVQRKTYFEKVCEAVPGTFYTLYFHQGELIAFNLLVNTQNALVDKYFGMEKETGRALNLYFVSWIENL